MKSYISIQEQCEITHCILSLVVFFFLVVKIPIDSVNIQIKLVLQQEISKKLL